ncbi:MAG: quinolinate synthase NadA [Streptococcaceae bacterium]|jgi:quinolinate synthase|nr:quinolinate synthase NadA [Streptococcaceae bacterium]
MSVVVSKQQIIPSEYLAMSEELIAEQIVEKKQRFGDELLILAHHYQKDEIIPFADEIGDSLQLARVAAANRTARHIVFCGVHFMAETADMLTSDEQKVYLPDALAGCSMADMANITQLEDAWEILSEQFDEAIIPITYINSTAAVKAFVGEHGGVIVTSGNAEQILKRVLENNQRVLFLPDQHLGRNTAYHLGIPLAAMALWQPKRTNLVYEGALSDLRVILWQGRCCVHQQYTVKQIKQLRQEIPDLKVIVHPECPIEVVLAADTYGSTKRIIDVVAASPAGTKWAIGTDNNLVNRMIKQFPNHQIISIDDTAFSCITMNRIRLAHLLWTIDEIEAETDLQQVKVDPQTTESSLKALDRMLS